MTKFFKDLTQEEVIERLTAQDVRTIMMNIDDGDFEFLADIIQGNGFVQYNRMTPSQLEEEYGIREDEISRLIDEEEMPWDVK